MGARAPAAVPHVASARRLAKAGVEIPPKPAKVADADLVMWLEIAAMLSTPRAIALLEEHGAPGATLAKESAVKARAPRTATKQAKAKPRKR